MQELSTFDVRFTVKSGGHSSVINASNIDGDGIVVDLCKFSNISIAHDKRSVTIASGARWRDVYQYIHGHGLSVSGGRAGSVGVGGYLLGGGLSVFSGTHGWACDSVLAYEVLLANGSIIQADLTQNADLFRSLKGGGSNFGIITKFRVEASDLQDVDTMSMAYRWQDLPKVMQAAAHFNDVARSDPGAAVILSIGIESTGHPPPITAFMTHPSNILDSPPLQELLAVDSQSYYHQRLTLTQLSEKLDLDNPAGFRQQKSTLTIHNDAATARLFAQLSTSHISRSNLTTDPSFRAGILFQPLTLPHLRAGLKNGRNILGLHDETEPLILISVEVRYSAASLGPTAAELIASLISTLESEGRARNMSHTFRYMNYASIGQDAFAAIRGSEEMERMLEVKRRYDDSDGRWDRRMTVPFKLV